MEEVHAVAKNDNAHSVRLEESLERNVGVDTAREFEEKFPLSKSANIEKKYQWAKTICDYLERHFDTDTIIKIRRECRCNDGKSIANKLLKYLNKADSVKEFVDLFSRRQSEDVQMNLHI